MEVENCCLLIGNSRWHWAFQLKNEWRYIHTSPNEQKLFKIDLSLIKWASVGEIPSEIGLNHENQLKTNQLPLINWPEWIGVDRALGTLGVLSKLNKAKFNANGFLLIDAGTILSLTKVSSQGKFEGGQLVAGLGLQISTMSKGAKNLSRFNLSNEVENDFPFATQEAMQKGTLMALIGLILEAHRRTKLPIWLCGGDSLTIYKELEKHNIIVFHRPDLVLEGLVNIIS
tara:strand:- start:66 stop:752 length:687 start_codon:yes stop_codon:yes gene_type:complete